MDANRLRSNNLLSGLYPSGFRVGDRIEVVEGPRTYNTHIFLRVGASGIVIEPPNIEGWPDDAVQVRMDDGSIGALDSTILRKVFVGQTYLS